MSCGPGKIGDWLVPDHLLGLDITPECQDHDDDYDLAETWAEKRFADDRLYERIKEKIYKTGGSLTPERLKLAKQYHRAVRWFGWISFSRILWRRKHEGLA